MPVNEVLRNFTVNVLGQEKPLRCKGATPLECAKIIAKKALKRNSTHLTLQVQEVGKQRKHTYHFDVSGGKLIILKGGVDPSENVPMTNEGYLGTAQDLNSHLSGLIEDNKGINTNGEQETRIQKTNEWQNVLSRKEKAMHRNKELIDIINSKKLKPVIVNKRSNFVVITYWWGRGRDNKNLQFPCPDNVKKNTVLTKQPQRFETMIETWKKVCKRANCNYLVQEYPEFAQPGMYQMAINAKPLFIRKALDTCGERSVVYIDGDMTINTYPAIFDIHNVDFMARGWNIDPRSSSAYRKGEYCYDNFVFETSGGIMFFANTPQARYILNKWHVLTSKYVNEGKADDRVLSMAFSIYNLFLTCNVIELPIEYLWLTTFYEPRFGGHILEKDHGPIIVEHPACLTSEETAADQGASKNRQPPFYSAFTENLITCKGHGGLFYEYIFFDEKSNMNNLAALESYKAYIAFNTSITSYRNASEHIPPFYRVPYGERYGAHDGVATANLANMIRIGNRSNEMKYTNNVVFVHEHLINNEIPILLYYLLQGFDVIFIPSEMTTRSHRIPNSQLDSGSNTNNSNSLIGGAGQGTLLSALKRKIKKDKDDLVFELVCFYDDTTNEHKPTFVENSPMFFSHTSRVLFHLLAMCKDIRTDFNDMFRSSFIFPMMIRCKFTKVKL